MLQRLSKKCSEPDREGVVLHPCIYVHTMFETLNLWL